MLNILTVSQMKKVEKNATELGVSYLRLMENAGNSCSFEIVKKHYIINTSVVILCGKGNNGGDGFVIAQKLYEKGANITVVLCSGAPSTPESITTFDRLNKAEVSVINLLEDYNLVLTRVADSDFIIDCVYGTGFDGEILGPLKTVIEKANISKAINIAIDIPSGINADTGALSQTFFKANYTYILGAFKKAHSLSDLHNFFGETELVDIGIPSEAFDYFLIQTDDITPQLIKDILPKRKIDANKGDFGKLLNISGSVGMGGAAIMSTLAALRSGVGLVCLATPKTVAYNAFAQVMEATTLPLNTNINGTIHSDNIDILLEKLKTSTACLIGCGLSTDEHTQSIVKSIAQNCEIPLIIDADGINCVARDINIIKTAKAKIIMTPHPGEMSRLTNLSIAHIQENRAEVAYNFAKEYNVVTILKGHETIVAMPNGDLYKNTTGNAGMAKGGSGDVLAGIVASFVAQGISAERSAILSVFLHGLCGDACAEKYSQTGMLARDMINELPLLFKKLDR